MPSYDDPSPAEPSTPATATVAQGATGTDATAPSATTRVAIAVLAGVAAGLYAYGRHRVDAEAHLVWDFSYPWRAARYLLDGFNPYTAIAPSGPFPFDAYFVYPLPAAVVALPVAPLPPLLAFAAVFAVSVALFTYAITRGGYFRLPALVSSCMASAAQAAQWSPLLVGAALTPPLAGLLTIKPTLGLALLAYRPTARNLALAAAGGGVLALVALGFVPTWPADWLRTLQANASNGQYVPPVLRPGGALLLLALLRWRRPEARLLAALALVPGNMFFYDELALFLVAQTAPEAALLCVLSHVAKGIWSTFELPSTYAEASVNTARVVLPLLYAPCLLMVLRRPNEGDAPAWLERAVSVVAAPARRVPLLVRLWERTQRPMSWPSRG